MAADNDLHGFGTCCSELREVLSSEDFEPLLYVADDGVLYMSIGVFESEDEDGADDDDEEEGPSFLDHPVYCCPFCGTRLQTVEEVERKTGA